MFLSVCILDIQVNIFGYTLYAVTTKIIGMMLSYFPNKKLKYRGN